MTEQRVPAVLSIAGSDSGGGAGIQADLKAFARCGVHGMTAITALTAQNTVGVTGIHGVPGDFIVEQVKAVVDDIGVDAVKIGMLGTAETVRAVREALALLAPGTPIVFCAVIAVIAVIPCTPQRANAFRSAWIPAPPPESEPAIESTAGTRGIVLRVRRPGGRLAGFGLHRAAGS